MREFDPMAKEAMTPMTLGMAGGTIQRLNQLEQLNAEQKRLEYRLKQVTRGQEILAKHPEILELLDILAGRMM